MNKHSTTSQRITPLPADNLARNLKIARPDTDEALPHIGLVGDTYTILLSGKDTNGRYCLIDMHIPPGGGPPPHRHDFEESFTVLEGEIEATFRGEKSMVYAGQTLSIPAMRRIRSPTLRARPLDCSVFARRPGRKNSSRRLASPCPLAAPPHPNSTRQSRRR